jgi:hypothetical protein
MKIIYAVLLLTLLGISMAFPQWKATIEENNYISVANSTQNQPSFASDGSGGAFIAWTDYRNSVTGQDIYIQRIDKDGFNKFQEDGIAVCNIEGTQNSSQIVATSDSCAIIFWLDNRTNYTNSTDLYAQKMDRQGNILWTSGGVPVSQFDDPTPGSASDFYVIADDNGGAYAAWIRGYYGYGQLRVQRIDNNGNIMWDSTGAVLTDGAVDSRSPRIVRNGSGITIVYRHTFGGYAIYYQIVNEFGSIKFTQPGKLVTTNGPQGATSIAMADTANGEAVVIAWSVGNFGLAGSLFVQAVDISGNKLWGDNHIIINNVPGEHSEFRIVKALNSSEYYLVWKDGRRINVAYDIYAQKINSNGQPQWTPNGILVCNTPYLFTNTSISANNDGVYVSWADTRASAFGIYAQKIKPDSTFEWINNGIRLTQNFDVLNLMTLDPEVNTGGALTVFSATGNPSGTGENIYAKYIGANGVLGGLTSNDEKKYSNPTEYYLSQNYPNPFNPSTRISWHSPVSGYQSLKVYDVLGNEVATLVDEYKSAGSYEVDFIASELPSGVYIYKLQSGDFIKTMKMILLK